MKKHINTISAVFGAIVLAIICLGTTNVSAAINDGMIIPYSGERLLTEADVSGLTLQELCYARNEIFAKHGRTFRSGELTEYFSTKSWYKPMIDAATFDEKAKSILNSYEDQNARFLLNYEKSPAHPDGYKLDRVGYDIAKVRIPAVVDDSTGTPPEQPTEFANKGSSCNGDVDGNGTDESISLQWSSSVNGPEPDNYWITVNGVSSETIHCEYLDKSIYLVSPDGLTTYIVVCDEGPSDDPISTFFMYKNGQVITAGQIDSAPRIMTVDSGVIHTIRVCKIFGTFSYNISWKTDDYGYWYPVEEEYYTRNTAYASSSQNEALVPVELYTEMDTNSTTIYLAPQGFTIIATDGYRWVKLRANDGQEGWFNAGDYESQGLNDMFRLSWAD